MSGSTNYDWPFVMDNSSNIPFSHKLTGSSSTSFGGSSGFTQTNPFGSATQPSQPDLEISIFGTSSQPAFGSTETEAPAFCFGSTPTQTNPFGSATQPSQPAFEIRIFGSSTPPLSQPAFGSTEAPAFGATSTPAFGATSASAFDATNPFETGLPLPTRFRFDLDDLFELTKDPLEHYSHHFERSNTYRTEAVYCLR